LLLGLFCLLFHLLHQLSVLFEQSLKLVVAKLDVCRLVAAFVDTILNFHALSSILVRLKALFGILYPLFVLNIVTLEIYPSLRSFCRSASSI